MKLIDSHCHLDFAHFATDIEQVLESARAKGVVQFIVPGVKAAKWQELINFASQLQGCSYALGVHPYFLDDFKPEHIEQLAELLATEKAVAVGECGIDTSIESTELQQDVFRQHIELANQFSKPLIIHHRKSHHLILQTFKQMKPKAGGVIHAFSGSYQDAKKYLDLGFKLGVGGTITYDRANKTREAIKQVPLQSIVLETDSPDMPMAGRQGMRNEPQYLLEVLNKLAELKQLPIEQVAEQTYLNTKQIFSLA